MKFVDLSQNPAVEVTVYTLRDIATRISSHYGSYALAATFDSWIADPAINTPAPDYTVSDVDYWKPEQIAVWQALYDEQKELEEERRVRKLAEKQVSVIDVLDDLVRFAERIERTNQRCYSHNRGNSMRDGRLRVVQLEGAIDFVYNTVFDGAYEVPKAKRDKLKEIVAQSKAHVKMQ